MAPIRIRPLQTDREFLLCEEIQRETWGHVAVTAAVLQVTQRYGGAVLGALAGQDLAGFLYAFLARRKGRLIHWSHMMAVREAFRDRGLGFRMKLLHRKLALSGGLRFIGWTFDPLESRNAALSLHRLGARADEYCEDYYGSFDSRIENGLPSDRFVVIWPIASRAVESRLLEGPPKTSPRPLFCVNETRSNEEGFPEIRRVSWDFSRPRVLVEIPTMTDAMRAQDLDLARRWRLETRRIFHRYFAAGFRATDFLKDGARGYYLLSRL